MQVPATELKSRNWIHCDCSKSKSDAECCSSSEGRAIQNAGKVAKTTAELDNLMAVTVNRETKTRYVNMLDSRFQGLLSI